MKRQVKTALGIVAGISIFAGAAEMLAPITKTVEISVPGPMRPALKAVAGETISCTVAPDGALLRCQR